MIKFKRLSSTGALEWCILTGKSVLRLILFMSCTEKLWIGYSSEKLYIFAAYPLLISASSEIRNVMLSTADQ